MKRDEFLESLTEEEMDKLIEDIDESKFEIDEFTKKRIEKDILGKINKKKKNKLWKFVGIAAGIILLVGLFNPTVLAYMKELLYFVPGVGVVENSTSEIYMGDNIQVTKGEELLLSKPIITADEKGLQLIIFVKSDVEARRTESYDPITKFIVRINGIDNNINYAGYSGGGSEREYYYSIYFDEKTDVGDKIEFVNEDFGIEIVATLNKLEAANVDDIPKTSVYKSTIFANPIKTEDGYDIYLFGTSEEYTTESFNHMYQSRDDMYFLKENGEKVKVIPPDGYGSDMMPPLKINGNPGKGELVFDELVFSTNDTISYKYKLPNKSKTIEPNETIQYGETEINIDRIYWDKENSSYAIDFSWTPNNNPKLFDPIGKLFNGVSYATWNHEEGTATIGIDQSKAFVNRGKFTLRNPEYIYEGEYKIPLNLE